jgi:hypothetical protein
MIDWQAVVTEPCVAVLGEPVIFKPVIGTAYQISGVYDDRYQEVALVDGMGVPTESPVIGVSLSVFAATPRQGDQITIIRTGEVFAVKKVRPDGHGAALLFLNSVSP